MKRNTTLLLGAISSLVAANACGSGFRLPESSIAGMNSANAVVADTGTTGAAPYNPATIAFHGNFLEAGFIGVNPTMEVTPAGGTSSVESGANVWHLLPNFYYARRFSPELSLGLGLNTPFGLETKWPAATFPLPAGARPTLSQLKMYNISPNIAYRIGDTSVAAGINYYRLTDLAFNTDLLTITGDGHGTGYTLAALHKMGAFSVGLSYRSGVTASLTGRYTNPIITYPAKLDLDLPAMTQIGINWAANDKLNLEFDIERTGWSSFDKLVIDNASTGANLVTSTNGWRDSTAYRLGATYGLSAKTILRAGFSYDSTAQTDEHFSARLADNDRRLFSMGVEQEMGGWSLSAGVMRVIFNDRTVSSAVPFGTYGADANGTAAYNGEYRSNATLIGLGVKVPL